MIYTQYVQTHLSLNRILLLILGLWPYQQSKLVSLQFGLLFGILTTFILSQVKSLIEQIQRNYDELKDENEIAIMDEYGSKTKCYTVILTGEIFLILSSISQTFDIEELVIQIIFLFCQYLYMFMGNNVAQQVTDHNDHVFASVYKIRWYVTPLQMQKMILFMLQRGNKAYYLQLGSLFAGSLKGFTSLMSASISYFTFIYSTRR
ncbi:PREDICTED: uncharacterized protein LOC106746678 [Dinoponera quadriceps]|uniref:Uncharacterized protein LOC106746678 n=1 Tax=Dinoponera quadriceps TaxID=609295 RepID=A0A6P3XL16_DINQU|nr:PREDICTED: uncharacterized protein LOC106746678 [Dinoponera quadriceps]